MFYTGVVENRTDDPLKLGRCRVRILGLHSPDKIELPTENLPWAVLMQPVNSAAMSGIGVSPTGLVEGTHVVVIFRDEFKQQPIIIGSFAGIPEPFVDKTILSFDTNESKALSVTPPAQEVTKTPGTISDSSKNVIKASSISVSEDAYTFIRSEEKCSSTVRGSNAYINYENYSKRSESTIFYSYEDSGGWAIGWGNNYLADGTRVTSTTKLSKSEVDSLLKYWVEHYADMVRSKILAPITQSMFDAMVSLTYNIGPSFLNSTIITAINTTDYAKAASQLVAYKNNAGSLTARRVREKDLFSKDGFPSKDMQSLEDVQQESIDPDDATENPVVTVKKPVESNPYEVSRKVNGFRDPNGVYPKIYNEPDTHRLARHENIDKTIVYSKEAARVTGVISGGNGKWNQPKVPYNAKYPYNHVRVTESGHIQEFDDTPDNERIHTYHRSGTYSEIDANGTTVNRIVGDDYEILERNGNVLIRGSLNVTIIGNQNIRVENDANIDIIGNLNMTVGGDYNLGVTGNININSLNNFMLATSGSSSFDSVRIDHNSGKGFSIPTGKGTASGVPTFTALNTRSRSDELESQYETPRDGDPAEYNKTLKSAGIVPRSISVVEDQSTEITQVDSTETKKPEPKIVDCANIPNDGPLDLSYKLSNNFYLRDLNGDRLKSGSAVPATRSEIICNLKQLAENCLEPIKQRYPSMKITSGYRNSVPPGGATNSDHLWGCAADIVISGFDKSQHYQAALEIVKFMSAWTQVILESRGNSVWIHVAYNTDRGLRMEKFSMSNDRRISPSLTEIVQV